MGSDNKSTLLILAALVALGALAAQKFMGRNTPEATTAAPTETPVSPPVPTPMAMPTPLPSPMPTPYSTPMPTPMAAATPFATPPMPMMPTGKVKMINNMDQEKARKMMMEMMKNSNMPKNFDSQAMRSREIIGRALNSEADARAAMKELESCAHQPTTQPTNEKVPAEFAAQMQLAQQQAKDSCISTAKEIGKKFPSLQGEVDSKILQTGKP